MPPVPPPSVPTPPAPTAPPLARVVLNAASGRSPWHGLVADGPALVADPAEPLATLAELDRRSRSVRHAGYFAYDLGRAFERLPATAVEDVSVPAFAFVPMAMSGEHRTTLFSRQAGPRAERVGSTFSRPAYESAVARALAYIAAGDVFQVNLSQRLAVASPPPAAVAYQELLDRFPAEFAAFLDFGRFQVVSNSPELFLRVTRRPDGSRRVVTRPIKGTRPNVPGAAADLEACPKDRAELAMIVDLQRNDLGRVCRTGSVVVTEPRTIETHPTVVHGVATVEGVLHDGVSLTDLLAATFPCGSVTGCPKIRAMQIIDEIEPVRRGVYCGAIGWVGGGELELSVAIRTITFVDGVAHVPVGGGVVADSTPADEYAETLVKARAMLAALGVA